MKIPKTFLFLFAAIAALGALTPHHASAQVSVSFFYDNLSPYGEWVSDPDYGYVWHPTNVDDNWAPYTDGYWAYTDAGWTWVSYEDYGGIVYHYGRWAHIPDEGWVWVPGETWAPAWVSWRSNDDYVGWAPLPPEAHWRADVGFGFGVDAHFDIGPGFYSFVGVRDFGAPALGAVIVNREQNVTIINNTTNITNITTNNSTVYTGGPNYTTLAARSSRPIPTLKLVRQTDAGAIRGANGKILSHQSGNSLVVLAPHVTAPSGGKLPAPPHVARTLTAAKADHGWDVVKDPTERASMESKFKSSAAGASLAARPVKSEDLKVVADKIKSTPATKPFTAEGSATPGGKKGKTKKTEDLTALENAPAIGGATPKAKKGKKSSEDYSTGDEAPTPKAGKGSKYSEDYNTSDEAPTPKVKKSKKGPTPDEYGDTVKPKKSFDDEYGDTVKPKKSSEDEYGDTVKPKKSSEDEYRPKETGAGDFAPGEPRIPKDEGLGGKGGEKSGKGKKGEGQPTPGQ
jgi:hypothetical protein